MPIARYLFGLLVAVLVESAAPHLWERLPSVLDPFLILTLLVARHGRTEAALVGGTVAGWAADSLSGGPFGFHGFADAAVGYLAALAARRLALDRPGSLAGMLAAAAAAQGVLLSLLGWLFLEVTELPPFQDLLLRIASTVAASMIWLSGSRLAVRQWKRRRERTRGGVRAR